MRLCLLSIAAVLLFSALPSVSAAATPAWELATANSVTAGSGHSEFVVQAMVTLPTSCYAARVRVVWVESQKRRAFMIEQLPPSSPCTQKTVQNCSVESAPLSLPIPQTISVTSKGPKTWHVQVSEHEPTPMSPVCRKG